MLNPTRLVIDAFLEELKDNYLRTYGILEPDFPNMIAFIGRIALENIANSDAAYHDVQHSVRVTQVGQEILKGKHLVDGGVRPRDWLNFSVAMLCHDIGYVRGLIAGDGDGRYVVSDQGKTVTLPPGATDASLEHHHVERSKLFIKQRFQHVKEIEVKTICGYIEHTRFPLEDPDNSGDLEGFAGLLRAASLIGQMADLNYLRKCGALFAEFQENGRASDLGYVLAADLRVDYPRFFWETASPLIGEGIRLLRVTQEGKNCLATMYANVFAEEHQTPALGAERWKG